MFDYQNQDKIFPPCPTCNGSQFQQLADNDRYNMGIKTVGCLRCGLVQTWPRLSPTSMSLFYQEHYRQYYQAVATPDNNYIKNYHKDERLAYTAKLINSNIKLSAGMRVLDVGCAEGTLFANLKLHCNDKLVLVGIEPSKDYASYARKMTACTTYFSLDDLISNGDNNFDLIIVNHVLEHVDNPVVFLRQLRGLLAQKGKLFIDVPDISCYSSLLNLHIAHIFHFSKQTLTAVLKKSGFEIIASEQHAPPYHPRSLWCFSEKAESESCDFQQSKESEIIPWKKIKWINMLIPVYLLKMRLRQNSLIMLFWNKLHNRTNIFN